MCKGICTLWPNNHRICFLEALQVLDRVFWSLASENYKMPFSEFSTTTKKNSRFQLEGIASKFPGFKVNDMQSQE